MTSDPTPLTIAGRRIGPDEPPFVIAERDAPAYEIAFSAIVDLPLIRYCAQQGGPLLLFTGMASLQEIEGAVDAALEGGDGGVILLHCTSAHPSPPEEVNLATITDLARRTGAAVGLCDHTLDTTFATVSVARGACVVGKHFTLSRAEGGADGAFSLEPDELARLVRDVSAAHVAVGEPAYMPTGAESAVSDHRCSLHVGAPACMRAVLPAEVIRSMRPARGLPPRHLGQVLGRRATRDLSVGEPLVWSMAEGRVPEPLP